MVDDACKRQGKKRIVIHFYKFNGFHIPDLACHLEQDNETNGKFKSRMANGEATSGSTFPIHNAPFMFFFSKPSKPPSNC